MAVLVKVGKMDGKIEEYALRDNAAVTDALSVSGTTVSRKEEIRVNGGSATMDTPLSDGDVVLVLENIKGNG